MANKKATENAALSFEKIRKITQNPTSKIHFVGIGGISMYSLARLAMLGGAKVSGSDSESSKRTEELSSLGAAVKIGHSAENLDGVALVVYTHAITADNVELVTAKARGIPVVTRAEYMGALMMGYTNRIGVSGSHGKSTTVSMLDAIFTAAKSEPTVLSGAELPFGEPLKVGARSLMIYEACEYKDSFLRFAPTISVGLNLELDHTDYFEGMGAMKDSFRKALGKATQFSVINGDDENFRPIMQTIKTKVITYGVGERNKYRYSITSFRESGFEFVLSVFGEPIGKFELNIPGVFNVGNAVAAIVTAIEFGLDPATVAEAIASYRGIPRRLEYVGNRYGRRVYYDYAHHPTEIRGSINAVKMLTHDLVTVIFKPHTYTRTKHLWEDFRMALSLADHVILTDIYPAREEPIEGITSEKMALEVGERATYCPNDDVLHTLDLKTHGVIIIMGAGDMEKIKDDVLRDHFKFV